MIEARGLVLAADGVPTLRVAKQLGVSPDRVRRWRARFAREGVEGVGRIAPGRGRRPSLPAGTVAEIVREGRLRPQADKRRITYHDSCYLARHNDVRSDPRELVEAVGTSVEMPRNRERTFCCGAGGAHMWMEERGGAINEARVREAAETGAETLAVACPFCTVVLDDGVRSTGASLEVVDVATLLIEAVERRGTGSA